MPCGCKKYHKKRKRGSGLVGRSSATWTPAYLKKGSGMSFRGGGLAKKRRRRKKGSGMSLVGSGMGFRGSGYVFDGSGFKTLVGRHK